MALAIVPATVADARAVGEVFAAAFRAGFAGLISEAAISEIGVAERRRAFEAQSLSGDPGTYRTWLARKDGVIVGFADSRPCADADVDAGVTGELHTLYVLADHWGRGVGRALFEHAAADLRARGFQALVLWVLTANQRARRFYAGCGCAPDGARKLVTAAGLDLPHVRYRRAL